jgi:hypothetical protein
MTTFALFPSGCSGSDVFRQLTERGSHTINDLCNLAIDSFHPSVDTTSGLQQLYHGHPSLLLCQIIQPPQSVLNIDPSENRSQIFF